MIFTAENIGEKIQVTAYLNKEKITHPKYATAVFECRTCLKKYEIIQGRQGEVYEPIVCRECGATKFKILPQECRYVDTQELHFTLEQTKEEAARAFKVMLRGPQCGHRKYKERGVYTITGVLTVDNNTNPMQYVIDHVTEINRKR